MIGVINYTKEELLRALENSYEISQALNPGACSRLFVTNDRTHVIKLFDGTVEKSREGQYSISYKGNGGKNLYNMQLIGERLTSSDYPFLSLPEKMIYYKNCLVGYIMPFFEGQELCAALADPKHSYSEKIDYFNSLASIILLLPEDVFVGDLHSHNVIVQENGNVVLVDVDGFSIKGGWMQTVPLPYCPNLPSKYFSSEGKIHISRNTDILCLFRLLFLFLFKGRDILRLPKHWIHELPAFFSQIGMSSQFVAAVESLFSEEDNLLSNNLFSDLSQFSHIDWYYQFLNLSGLCREENEAAIAIDQIITRKEWLPN